MAVQKYALCSTPGSCDITEKYTQGYTNDSGGDRTVAETADASYISSVPYTTFGNENEESLLIDGVTELLHKEFGEMPLLVSVIRKDMARCFEIRVRYGIEGNHYICENIGRDRFLEVRDDYGLQMVAKVTAANLIRHIRTDIMDTMFGSEIKEKIPNGTSQEEKAFRKILI